MLKDKICIVTGAASGIGLAIAETFANDGAKVIMADVNEEKLSVEAKRIGGDYFKTDLSKVEDCKGLVDFTINKYSKVDVLVNVAGIQNVCPIEEFPEDKWKFMMDLMLTAPFLLTKYVFPSMKAQGWGRIINMGSIHGMIASEYKSAYVSAKHGLGGLTKATAVEGGKYGITCNMICPSYVRTPLVDKQIADQAKTHGISEDKVISDIMLQKAFVKKLLEPKDVGEVAKFLCSETGDFMTGGLIPIDCGWTAS